MRDMWTCQKELAREYTLSARGITTQMLYVEVIYDQKRLYRICRSYLLVPSSLLLENLLE